LYEKTLGKQTVFFPGMTDLLTLLKANQTPWGIVTNKPKRFSEPLLKKFGLWHETPCIVSGDTLPVCKPHPDPIHHACKLLQINPYTSLYVGDALNDVQASHAAGMRSCVAQYGYIHEEEDSKAWQATYYVTSPSQIYSIFSSLNT
jgi:2-phosphoglycolate phosphatase